MHIVSLLTTQPPADPGSYAGRLWKGMTETKKLKIRIYRTYVYDNVSEHTFVLMTTSKDLQLKFSSFDHFVQYNLVKFLEEECKKGKCSRLLLCFRGESENSEEGLLVTRTDEGDEIIFTIALAR